MLTILWTILCVVFVIGLLMAESQENALFKAATKIPASLAFIATALLNGALEKGTFGEYVVLGLVLGAVGDVALLSRKTSPFRLGIVAFLLSHVAYCCAFVALGVSWMGGALALVLLVPLGVGIRRWVGDKAGSLGPAVTAYVVIITAMVVCASAALTFELSPQRMLLLGAAVVFYASDICVARDRFIAPGFENRVIGLPLYYTAQLMFAWSVVMSPGIYG